MLRLLVSADLDAYEARENAVLDFTTRLEVALSTGDELDVHRVRAEAAGFELRNPGVRVLDELDAITAA